MLKNYGYFWTTTSYHFIDRIFNVCMRESVFLTITFRFCSEFPTLLKQRFFFLFILFILLLAAWHEHAGKLVGFVLNKQKQAATVKLFLWNNEYINIYLTLWTHAVMWMWSYSIHHCTASCINFKEFLVKWSDKDIAIIWY